MKNIQLLKENKNPLTGLETPQSPKDHAENNNLPLGFVTPSGQSQSQKDHAELHSQVRFEEPQSSKEHSEIQTQARFEEPQTSKEHSEIQNQVRFEEPEIEQPQEENDSIRTGETDAHVDAWQTTIAGKGSNNRRQYVRDLNDQTLLGEAKLSGIAYHFNQHSRALTSFQLVFSDGVKTEIAQMQLSDEDEDGFVEVPPVCDIRYICIKVGN